MSKSSFLLVDLSNPKTKILAETITSDTSRKILDYLAQQEDTETSISAKLNIPLSTVHYHLQKLQEAGLIIVEQFHYSQKGKEVQHYKLANKYIIIAPKAAEAGILQKLKGVLPAFLLTIGIATIIKFITTQRFSAVESVAESAAAPTMMAKAADVTISYQPDIALWFLLGSLSVTGMYILTLLIKEKITK